MTTNIRKYVDVIVSRATRPIDTANFNTPLFLTETNLFDANERIRTYNDVDEMTGDGWSPTSAAVRFATNVFSGTFRPQTVMIGKKSFTRFEVSVLPGSVEYFLTIIAVGVAPQTITFTGTELTSEQAVVDGLVAAITGNSLLTGVVVAANVNDNLEITPQGNNVVTVTGLSANLQGNINQFSIDVTSGVGAQDYSITFDSTTSTFTSDTTPTKLEVETGLLAALQTTWPLSGSNIPAIYEVEDVNSGLTEVITPSDGFAYVFEQRIGTNADGTVVTLAGDELTGSPNIDVTYVSGSVITSTFAGTSLSVTLDVSGVAQKTFTGDIASITSQINNDPDYTGKLVGERSTATGATALRLLIKPIDGTTQVSVSSVDLGAQGYNGYYLLNLVDSPSTFSFDISSEGITSTISATGTNFTPESEILDALAADITGTAALLGVVTASVSGGQLLIDPTGGTTVNITNVSSNLSSSFDKFVVDPTTGGGGVRYAFDLEATSASVSQTIEYTSDTTPTVTEILQGLSDQINNSGVFNTALVAGVDGNVLSITPNLNQDVSLSSLTDNLMNTVIGAETTEEALAEAAGEDDSWFFLSAEDKTPTTQLALGRYAQANDKMYITTIPASTVASTADDDIASQLMNAQLDNTHTLTVPDERLEEQAEGGVIGAIASINPGESILAFKSMPGVSVTEFSSTEQNRIQGKNSNIYPLVNGVAVYDNGVNQSGLFFDDVRFGLWMKARIAEAVFGLLKRESDLGRKVVFGDTGFEQIRQVIYGQVINVAIRRNAILTPQDGVDAAVVRIPARSEIPDNDIANRTLRDVVVEFTYSGAIQQVFARVFILI